MKLCSALGYVLGESMGPSGYSLTRAVPTDPSGWTIDPRHLGLLVRVTQEVDPLTSGAPCAARGRQVPWGL